jgi:outer membrane protein, adhesin transport system
MRQNVSRRRHATWSALTLLVAFLLQSIGLFGCAQPVSMTTGEPSLMISTAQSTSPRDAHMRGRDALASNKPASAPKVVSLRDMGLASSVGLALAKHPDIGRADAAVSRSRADVTVAQSSWYPKLGYTSNISGLSQGSAATALSDRTHVVGLEVSQLVYDFGRANSDIAANEATNRQREAEMRDTMERVALTTSEAHLELARATQLLLAADLYIESLRKLHETIRLRAASGAAGQADVYFADVRLQTAQGERIRAMTRQTAAQARLYRIIGVRPQSVGDPNAAILAIASRLAGHGTDGATGVAAAQHAATAAKAKISLAEASLYPSISLKGSRTFAISDPLHEHSDLVGLSIQGDLFTGGAAQGRITAAQKDAVAAERAIELARLASSTEVDAADADVTSAKLRRVVFSRQADLARKSRDIYLDEYQLGKRTLTEVLNAEQEISRAEAERINAVADAWSAVVRAAAARAELVSSLEPLSRQ